MIRYVKHDQIDRSEYDACLMRSGQFRIYACSWYLDAVAVKWDLLVLDDYRAVMPLPVRQKLGLSYVYTPVMIQQLGVFSTTDLDRETEEAFYRRAVSEFALLDYRCHRRNLPVKGFHKRINYVLPLDQGYQSIQEGYNQNRKRTVRTGFENFILDKQGDTHLFLEKYAGLSAGFSPDRETVQNLERLLNTGNEAVSTWNVFLNEVWVGGLVWLVENSRITYLVPTSSIEGRELKVSTFLVDSLIRQYQDTGALLDFEGSMIPGVARFYESFGAEKEYYYQLKSRVYGIL